jgi:hypothetical protein
MPDKKTFLPEQAEIDAVIGEFNGDTDALAAFDPHGGSAAVLSALAAAAC